MTFSRAALLKMANALRSFDLAASAFVGLQWGDTAPLFYRSSRTGYIETDGYRSKEPPALIVRLEHLRTSLSNLQEDEIDLANCNGILTLSSTKGYVTELKVHTLRPGIPWMWAHVTGKPKTDIQLDGFGGIKTDDFPMGKQPVLRNNRLMFITDFGVVMRSGVPVTAFPYPRDSFLKVITTNPVDKLCMTDEGFWMASAGGFQILVAGHRAGDEMFDLYSVGATPLADFPAGRLIQALTAASNLADKESRILLDPAKGIVARDQYSQESRFAIGDTSGWTTFTIPPKTADLLVNAFVQAKEDDTIKLAQIDADTMRFTRGLWEVSFKVTSRSWAGKVGNRA